MYATKLIERVKPVLAMVPNNYTGAAGTNLYVALKYYNHATILIQTGAWAGGTAAVTINQATTVSGGSAKALAFTQYWTTTSLADDTLTLNTASSNTFNLSAANTLYVIELDAATLDISGGFYCFSVVIASPGANNDYYAVSYLLSSGLEQALLPKAQAN